VTGSGSYTVVLAWGGHIASAIDWGVGNSFDATSGSSAHMALVTPNKDLAINANAVAPLPDVTTQVANPVIGTGGTLTDTANLSGSNGIVTGTVQFYYCTVMNLTDGCAQDDPMRTATGPPVTLSGGSATSAPIGSGLHPGNYCIGVRYHHDGASFYSDTYYGSATNECFTVVGKAQPIVTTRLSADNVSAGTPVSDTATISTSAPSITGSLSYRWYTSLGDCQADTTAWPLAPSHGTDAGGPFSVTGAGLQHVSSSVAFDSPGTYYWAAFYSGDGSNAPAVSDCTTEALVVGATPAVSTRLSDSAVTVGERVTDQAVLSGATSDAGGNVNYRYYGSLGECQADAGSFSGMFPSGGHDAGTKPVSGGVVDHSDPVAISPPGTYYWAAFYSGDASNAPAVSDCTTEVLVVKPAAPEHPKIVTKVHRKKHFLRVDSARLTGTRGTVTGTVKFFLCPKSSFLIGCPQGRGLPIPPPMKLVNGSATSAPIGFGLKRGVYCVGVLYQNDGKSPYLDTYSGSPKHECFKIVTPPPPPPPPPPPGPPMIKTHVSKPAIKPGGSLVDTATLSGFRGTVTGTVDFLLCSHTTSGCPQGRARAIQLGARLVNGSARSKPFGSRLRPGRYCVGVRYRNDGRSPYANAYSGSRVHECFIVLKPKKRVIIITHLSRHWIVAGGSARDFALLKFVTRRVHGVVRYRYYSTLHGCLADTSRWPARPRHGLAAGTVPVHGAIVHPSRWVRFFRPGTYYWAAFYSGSSRYAPAASRCLTEVLRVGRQHW